ncbi:hypothetical protein BDN72DRAFT_235259 [Pluteus cervinus]|uniref:Uncharacterized protein n=1 Tax=Pluteus cervinus TaxID=181527 RepID=A0ACD3BFN2_9AGAR|nr:hypothetical protein BDN72DRAFT_235259 [Pluteus cervinus]
MDSHTQLNLHHARQRQATVTQGAAFTAPRMDDRSTVPKNGQFSPQRYDSSLGKDATRYPASASPTRPFGSVPFATQQNGIQGAANYESLQNSTAVNEDLSLALRGMAVEDDYSAQQSRPPAATASHLPPRGPPMPVPRGPYSGYPQAEYAAYYSMPVGRDSYADYSYGYDAYRGPSDPSMYASPVVSNASPSGLFPNVSPQGIHPNPAMPDVRQQAGMFFEYTAGRPPGSPYFYAPHQAALYQQASHSPMMTPQLQHSTPATLGDKKREMQVSCTSDFFQTI